MAIEKATTQGYPNTKERQDGAA